MKYTFLSALVLFATGVHGQDPGPPEIKGPQAPDGLKALKDPDPAVRYKAASLLVRLGPVGKIAIPELRACLKDSNGYVRVKAAEALWTIDKTAPTVLVPVLVAALKNRDPGLRAAAVPVLGKMGAKAKNAVPSDRGS
jgi:HEAT repeat protein